MKIIEILGMKFGQREVIAWAARDMVEAMLMARCIQEEGGLPLVHEIEVPDDFNNFTLDLPGKLEEPSIN